jgi:hypothetical protein
MGLTFKIKRAAVLRLVRTSTPIASHILTVSERLISREKPKSGREFTGGPVNRPPPRRINVPSPRVCPPRAVPCSFSVPDVARPVRGLTTGALVRGYRFPAVDATPGTQYRCTVPMRVLKIKCDNCVVQITVSFPAKEKLLPLWRGSATGPDSIPNPMGIFENEYL